MIGVELTLTDVLADRFAHVLTAGYGPAIGCHDLGHAVRVASLAERLAAVESVDPTLCVAAALFHDIGYRTADGPRRDDHEERSARITADALAGDLRPDELDAVVTAVRGRRFSKLREPKSDVARVLDDSDNLDALGAVGVARAFLWAGEHQPAAGTPAARAVHDALARHCADKLDRLPALMHTETGRRVARARQERLRAFVAQLGAEVEDGLW